MPSGPIMAKEFWIGDVQAGAHDGAEVELKGWIGYLVVQIKSDSLYLETLQVQFNA